MEKGTTERLSRLIDGDLDRAETEEVMSLLESNRALRRELDGLNRVRASLRSLADREHPPAELDALVDPLLRGRPESVLARPWARWLAAAAVVVLGVTVVLEVRRGQPDPARANWQERVMEGATAEPTERFSLAPLPTSSEPSDARPVGAADRLVSAPDPEVDPTLDPAPALEVMGPLENAIESAAPPGSGRRIAASQAEARSPIETDEPPAVREQPSRIDAAAEKSRRGTSLSDADRSAPSFKKKDRGPEAEESPIAIAGAQLFVFMEAETAWRSFTPAGPCEPGRYALRIRIEDGVVREVWPVANPPAPTRQVRASQLVLGLSIDDVVDGEYSAEVVIDRDAGRGARQPP